MLESKWRNFRIELNQYYFSCKSRDYYSHDGANEGNFVQVSKSWDLKKAHYCVRWILKDFQ